MSKRNTILIGILALTALVGVYFLAPMLQGQPPAPPVVPKDMTSFREVVKQVLPAVVSIEARNGSKLKARQAPRLPNFDDLDIPEEFRRFFEEFRRAPQLEVPDLPRQGFGSGFIIDPKGVVMTNFHVVEGADHVIITLNDGRKFTSKDIKGDRKTDLAIVRFDPKGAKLTALELGDSDSVEIGDRVLAFGAPFGLTGSVTHGIISAKGRSGLSLNMYEDFLQTDAAINPGNSGGPLVTLDGKVVGINAAIRSRSGGWQGVGLAVASNLGKNVMKALMTEGVVRRGYLGIQIRDLTPELSERFKLEPNMGVIVSEVFSNSPAAKAGLKDGDIILKINGQKVKDGRMLQSTVAGLPLNQAATLEVLRDNQTLNLRVIIEQQPDEFGTARTTTPSDQEQGKEGVSLGKIGVEVTDLTPALAQELGYSREVKGAAITSVERGSLAASVGLRQGMVITKVDNTPVTSAAAAREALEQASLQKGILLQVRSPRSGTNYVLLQAS